MLYGLIVITLEERNDVIHWCEDHFGELPIIVLGWWVVVLRQVSIDDCLSQSACRV